MAVLRRHGARLDDFFNNCTAMYGAPCQADIMAVHYYGCTTADLQTCAPWLGTARLSATLRQAPPRPRPSRAPAPAFAARSLAWQVCARSWAAAGSYRAAAGTAGSEGMSARVRRGRPASALRAAAAARRFMVQMAQKYNRPIWLTEFACGGAGTYDQIAQVMQSMLTMLDNQAMVARCARAAHARVILAPARRLMSDQHVPLRAGSASCLPPECYMIAYP